MKPTSTLLVAALLSAQTLTAIAQTAGSGPIGSRPSGRGVSIQFAAGTVNAVDTTAGTVTITPRRGGHTQTIKIGPDTQVVMETPTPVTDLKVGDQVQVTGIPTEITASQIVAGQLPSDFTSPGRRNAGGGRQGGQSHSGGNAFPFSDTLSAKVTQTNPLTLTLSDSVSLTVKIAPNTKVSRISTVALGSVKSGDQILATGQAGDNGAFMAKALAVNIKMGGFGRANRVSQEQPVADNPAPPLPSAVAPQAPPTAPAASLPAPPPAATPTEAPPPPTFFEPDMGNGGQGNDGSVGTQVMPGGE